MWVNDALCGAMGANTKRFEDYVSMIAGHLGHADRVEPFRGYCTGLLLPGERKSVEPMAARVRPRQVRCEHLRLHHFVADAPWSDQAVLGAVRSHVLGEIKAHAGVVADAGYGVDTAFRDRLTQLGLTYMVVSHER